MIRYFLIAVHVTFFAAMHAQAQTIIPDSINKFLDTTFVTFRTTELSTHSDEDLKEFIPRFYEFRSIDHKYDSVSHGYGALRIGAMIKCDSVKGTKQRLVIYISSRRKSSLGLLMPLDLMVSSNHYGQEFLLEFLFKLSYLSEIPITNIFIITRIDPNTNADTSPSASIAQIKLSFTYAIFFTHELSIAQINEKPWTIKSLQKESYELHQYMERYYPTAMLVMPRDVFIQIGLTTQDRREIVKLVKQKVENYMKAKYKNLGNKFVSDGSFKFSFNALSGEITKRPNFWEYFEIGILYTPYDEKSGQFVFTFEGRYKQANPFGAGPDPKVIKKDGTSLEEQYSDEVRSYLNDLSVSIEKYLNNERKQTNQHS